MTRDDYNMNSGLRVDLLYSVYMRTHKRVWTTSEKRWRKLEHRSPLVDPGIYFGGGANQNSRSKVEGEAWVEGSKRPKRAKPEPRAKSEKKLEEGFGDGLGEPLPRKVLKNRAWNYSFWCRFEANQAIIIIWNNQQNGLIANIHEKSLVMKSPRSWSWSFFRW